MATYNGHVSWNAWNVSLWISNDEPTYRFAIDCLERPSKKGEKPSLTLATTRFMEWYGGAKTPDGAVFNRKCVMLALEGLSE